MTKLGNSTGWRCDLLILPRLEDVHQATFVVLHFNGVVDNNVAQ